MEILGIPLCEFEVPLKNFNLVTVSQKLKHIKNLLKSENIYTLREKDNNIHVHIKTKSVPYV